MFFINRKKSKSDKKDSMTKNSKSNKNKREVAKQPSDELNLAFNKSNKNDSAKLIDRFKILALLIYGLFVLFLLLSLFSYSSHDPGIFKSAQSATEIYNYAGIIGAYTSSFILSIFGVSGFLIPFIAIYSLWMALLDDRSFYEISIFLLFVQMLGLVVLIISGAALSTVLFSFLNELLPQRSGGIIGYEAWKQFDTYLNSIGGFFALSAIFLVGLTLYSGSIWLSIVVKSMYYLRRFVYKMSKYSTSASVNFYKGFKKAILELMQSLKIFSDKIKQCIQHLRLSKNKIILSKKHQNEPIINKDDPVLVYSEPALLSKINGVMQKNDSIEPNANLNAPVQDMGNVASKQRFNAGEVTDGRNVEVEQYLEAELYNDNDDISKVDSKKMSHKLSDDNLPSLSLLEEPERKTQNISKDYLVYTSRLVEEKLSNFNISVKVVGAYPGPVVTRYELELAPGIKVSKLSSLAQDLARELASPSVRIVEIIPGKTYVGIELPNADRAMVRIKEVLGSDVFKTNPSPLAMGLGVDISGKSFFADLAKMPHLLVAGTTGSGKSVGVNAMIISMLYKASPEDLKFIMIDPKMLELSIYDNIPHLLTPVVTDMGDAANALRWCVREMDRRYELMSLTGVRNIASLNQKIMAANAKGEPMKDPLWLKLNPNREFEAPNLEKMPFIVTIADEFADMIMTVGKKVEELIARLAQKARAAGIHLILATQRPSVDVVTGLIKANIPTRISFQVSSRIDSRTILDQQGAEQLLGNGDMLYLKPGFGAPLRVHGCFVSDEEVHKVVEAWKSYGKPTFIKSITDADGSSGSEISNNKQDAEQDELYDEAVSIVLETKKASISGIQRRLRIGYNRAARLVEAMEESGIVSPMQSNGMREILIAKEL